MIKNNMRIKENITIVDKINAVESIVSSCFTYNEKTNKEEYTPYYKDMAATIAVATTFVDGITFDEEDYVYDYYKNDKELSFIVDKFMESETMTFVVDNADKMIEFKKEQILHKNDILDKIGEFCDVMTDALENFAKLKLKDITKEDLGNVIDVVKKIQETESVTDVIKEASNFNLDKATAEIIDSKNEEIRKLKDENKKLLKFRTLHESRNVIADK